MKKSTVIALILFFVDMVIGAEPIKVSNTASDSVDPRIEVSQTTGDINIVWREVGPIASGLYFRHYNSEGLAQTSAIKFSKSLELCVFISFILLVLSLS